MTKRWYVVQTTSGFEKKVADIFREGIKSAGLEDLIDEVLVPTENVAEIRKGKKITSEKTFYPSYILIKMELTDVTWHFVKNTTWHFGSDKVGVQFVGGKRDKPAPISDKEAQAILQRIQDGVEKPRPKILFEPGEVVRITEGPFSDFNGVIEEVNYEKNRLHVAVVIFGRSTPVELEFGQVQKA